MAADRRYRQQNRVTSDREKSFMYMEMLYVRQKFSPKEDRKFVLQRQGRQAVR